MPTFTAPDGSPVTLTPQQQAQALQLASTPTFTKPDGTPVTLTSEQQAQALQLAAQPPRFTKPDGSPLDPVQDLNAEQMAALNEQAPDTFSLTGSYNSLAPEARTPDIVAKLAEAHDIVSNRKPWQDLPGVGTVFSNVWEMAKGVGQLLANTARGAQLATGNFGAGTPPTPEQMMEVQRGVAEGWSGTESAVTGLATQIANKFSVGKTHPSPQAFVPGFGSTTPQAVLGEAPEATAAAAPQRKVQNFLDAAAQAQQQSQILVGKGEFMQAAGGGVLDDLAKAGYPVRPEESAKLAAVDPFTWYAFGKAFDALGPAVKAAMPAKVSDSIAAVSAAATGAVKKAVGGAANITGSVLGMTGKALEKSAPYVGRPVAAIAAVHAGVPGAVTGLVFGKGMTESLSEAGNKIAEAAKGMGEFGEGVAGASKKAKALGAGMGAAAGGPISQAAKSVIEAALGAAAAVAKGAALDVGLQATTAETPEQKAAFTPIGTALGAMHGALGAGKWVLGGQLAGERNWGATAGVPNSAAFPQLNQLHNAAMSQALPKIQERIRAVQQLKQGVNPNTDVFYVPPAPTQPGEISDADAAALGQQRYEAAAKTGKRADIANLSRFSLPDGRIWDGEGEPGIVTDPKDPGWKTIATDPLESALQNTQGAERHAWQAGDSNGVFLKDLTGADGKKRNAIIFRKVGAAPHEAIHAMDVALGDQRVSELNAAAKQENAGVWDQFTQRYAEALNDDTPLPAGTNPGEFLLDRSGFGAEAARQKNGGTGEDWQTSLTDEEKQAVLDKYVGGEIRAENGDAYFKRYGNKPMDFAGKMASAAAELVSLLGGNPLQGRVSSGLKLPLDWKTFKQTGKNIAEAQGKTPPAAREVIRPKGAATQVPQTLDETAANAQAAQEIAKVAPAVAVPGESPTAPGVPAQSDAEKAGVIAEAIASGTTVRFNKYRGAPGQPPPTGGSPDTNMEQREAEIEAARNIPESERDASIDRLHTPYKLEQTGKGLQSIGFSHADFAANAIRWAKALTQLHAADPTNPALANNPFPMDWDKGEHTPGGWQQLFEAARKFSANQGAGFTGSGLPVIVPPGLEAEGVHTPSRTTKTAPEQLSQPEADYINMLYGQRPPKTPRQQAGVIPKNISHQMTAAATGEKAALPARVVEPAKIAANKTQAATLGVAPGDLIERAPFAPGAHGITEIKETNPTRGALENALQANKIAIPKLSEVTQRLNLSHMHSVAAEPGAPGRAINQLTTGAGFMPKVSEFLDSLDKTSPEEWRDMSHTYQGKFGGGQTGLSWDVGAGATSREEVAALRSAQDKFGGMVREALKTKDFQTAAVLGSKAQAAREAYEAATDTGGTSEFIRRYHPESGFKAPFPETAPEPTTAQYEPASGDVSPMREMLSTKDVGDMSPAELKEHYPEAIVVPDRAPGKPARISSDITSSPLYKEAGSEPKAVDTFAKRLADFARQYEDNAAYKDGLRWFSEFQPLLKKHYGEHAQIMAELLAATSPRNPPQQNFAMANDALEMWKRGKFDKQLAKFEEGIKQLEDGSWKKSGAPTEAKFMQEWTDTHDLKPRQSNGKLYGMHSIPVLQVLARRWLENTAGPKTQNFVKNLLGTGHGATYDVWADRTLRRIGYSGHQARWRILPKNSVGVSDADFAFGQKVFAKAAKELGVRPDSLQGGLWFAEKQLWADNGWGRLDLGDFRKEIQNREMLNQEIPHRLAASEAAAAAPKAEQLGIEPRKLR